jgi:hypothetical protein
MFEIANFIKRNATWFLLGLISLLSFLFIPGIPEFLQVVILSIVLGSLTIFLSGFALYTYTPIKFTDWDIKLDIPTDIQAAVIKGKAFIIGCVFIGISVLIAGITVGTYFVMFAD